MSKRPISPLWIILACALWMTVAGNLPLWRKLTALGLTQTPAGLLFTLDMAALVFAGLLLLLGLFAWRWTLKGAATLLLLITACSGYFMYAYGVVMDPGMMTNAVQTDVHETTALLSWQLLAWVGIVAVLPGWLLWRQPLAHGRLSRQLGRQLGLMGLGLLVGIGALYANFQTLASVMRNHPDVRYLINPLAPVYSASRVAARPFERDDSVLVRTGEDARLSIAVSRQARAPLLLLVLGETGRSGNFSINGYPRPTTPELERAGVVSFRNAWACGTSTAASVPCMFSDLGQEHFEQRKHAHEGLLDVLQRAGLAVLWIDNQSGCKGVCDRVPSVSTASSGSSSPLCAQGECLDGVMLEGLDARIAALDPQRVARGLVIVMHQMGSHGPAYHLRSPAAFKRFQPECTSAALPDCSREALVNAYDNSIAYTDHFLAQAIAWLKNQSARADTAMVYVADHGESLGENNLYLHGMPYAVAPDVQKHIPWITWASDGFQRSTGLSLRCLQGAQERRLTHDHYFHSVLGLMDVETQAYRPALDAYAGCRESSKHVALVDDPQ
jgi:lipid A ethanolaminephosphotransferase